MCDLEFLNYVSGGKSTFFLEYKQIKLLKTSSLETLLKSA